MIGMIVCLFSFVPLIAIGITIEMMQKYNRGDIALKAQKTIIPTLISFVLLVVISFMPIGLSWNVVPLMALILCLIFNQMALQEHRPVTTDRVSYTRRRYKHCLRPELI